MARARRHRRLLPGPERAPDDPAPRPRRGARGGGALRRPAGRRALPQGRRRGTRAAIEPRGTVNTGDADGNEYTTFREQIGKRAQELEGRRVRIEFHDDQRGQFTNVYLDKVEEAPAEAEEAGGADTDPAEAAWRTAVDAAPWLVGESDPDAKTDPEELYETLKPFKDKVADDIKQSDDA